MTLGAAARGPGRGEGLRREDRPGPRSPPARRLTTRWAPAARPRADADAGAHLSSLEAMAPRSAPAQGPSGRGRDEVLSRGRRASVTSDGGARAAPAGPSGRAKSGVSGSPRRPGRRSRPGAAGPEVVPRGELPQAACSRYCASRQVQGAGADFSAPRKPSGSRGEGGLGLGSEGADGARHRDRAGVPAREEGPPADGHPAAGRGRPSPRALRAGGLPPAHRGRTDAPGALTPRPAPLGSRPSVRAAPRGFTRPGEALRHAGLWNSCYNVHIPRSHGSEYPNFAFV